MKAALLARSSLRFWGRHPWQLILAITGIALGVAVFAGIQLANDSARRAFEASSTAFSGLATHRLLPVAGLLPESRYVSLKQDQRFVASAPVIEVPVTLIAPNGRRLPLTLAGQDLIEEIELRNPLALAGAGFDPLRLIGEPDTALLSARIADLAGIAPGDRIEVTSANGNGTVHIIGLTEQTAQDNDRLTTDIATGQALAGIPGFLSRVDLKLDEAHVAELSALVANDAVVVPAESRDQTLGELTRAFNTNLTALGLLALLVGMFLIYSTISFTIVQRWRSIALFRALGLNRRELTSMLLGEGFVIGTVGTALGLILGKLLASGLLELVLRTLDDLYFRRALAAGEASSWVMVYSGALGLGATLLSALTPTIMALRRPIADASRSRLERGARDLARRFAWGSLPTLTLAGFVLLLAPRSLTAAFFALFLVLAAGAMLVPIATKSLMGLLEQPLGRLTGLPGYMAVRGVGDSLSRTGVATAALTVAVATVMSIGLMIGSFRSSLIEWIETTTTADLYVELLGQDGEGGTDAAVVAIAQLPGIEGISRMRVTRLATPAGEFSLRATTPGPEGYGIDIAEPADASAEALLANPDTLLIAEPLAYRLELRPGDSFALPTSSGLREFNIAGVYRDYNTAGSELVLTLDAYRAAFDDSLLSSLGVHLTADADEAPTMAQIRSLLAEEHPARVRSTGMIRELSLVIFDRTFQITEVLRLLAGIVAFLGVLSAVMALQLEREREFALLRSLGMSIRQLFGQNLAQTSLLGLAAGIAALPLGTALAWLLIHVINRRSFGWTIDFEIAPVSLVAGLAMAVIAAVLAGIYPALVGARADMGLSWRDD